MLKQCVSAFVDRAFCCAEKYDMNSITFLQESFRIQIMNIYSISILGKWRWFQQRKIGVACRRQVIFCPFCSPKWG